MSEPIGHPAPPRRPTPGEWASIGVRFFSWIAGIALVLAAVLTFRSPAGNGWGEAAAGLALGIALLLLGELRIARSYSVTANALDAAGIGILYATLYAMHARWHLIPLPITSRGATRRSSPRCWRSSPSCSR
jgi:hypothetical protein